MKQIFDWLREQINEKAFPTHENYSAVWHDDVMNTINEAEAKWEAEVCEWEALGDYHKSWKFCPYCGKPIKISEVE